MRGGPRLAIGARVRNNVLLPSRLHAICVAKTVGQAGPLTEQRGGSTPGLSVRLSSRVSWCFRRYIWVSGGATKHGKGRPAYASLFPVAVHLFNWHE